MSPSSLLKMAPRRRLEAAASPAPGPGGLRGEGADGPNQAGLQGRGPEGRPRGLAGPAGSGDPELSAGDSGVLCGGTGAYRRCEFGEPRLPLDFRRRASEGGGGPSR